MAQMIGLICHEYGYTPEQVGRLTTFQFQYLLAWLEWRLRRG